VPKKKCSVPGCRRRAQAKGFCGVHYGRHLSGRPLQAPIVKRVYGPIAKRLKAHLKIDKDSGCHLWTGHRDADGYGLTSAEGKRRVAHRVAWEVANGPIPEGMIVMHTCDNPACCNPEHLQLGTHAENTRDRIKKGRGPGARARDLELNPQWAAKPLWARKALSQRLAADPSVKPLEQSRPAGALGHDDGDAETGGCHVPAAERQEAAAEGRQ
jgi:hypothetical protein